MKKLIKKLIRLAIISAVSDDDQQFPEQQIKYKGKVANAIMLWPYGMHGNAAIDSLLLMMNIGADDSNRAGIPLSLKDRPMMAADEFCLFHPKTQSIIHFKSNSGDIDIDVVKNNQGNININAVQANITASNSVTIDTPETTITGNVQIDGALNVNQDITGLMDIIATALVQGATLTISGAGSIDGQDYKSHTHAQGNDSDGDTQVNTGGVV